MDAKTSAAKLLASPWVSPTMVTLLAALTVVTLAIVVNGGDPLALARLGTRYAEGDPEGTPGYDGQFGYYIARDPNPEAAAPYLDVPAYRYQRILMPLLARALALGNQDWLPWTLALVGLLSHAAGTWTVERLLTRWGVNRWYALLYGLYAGFLLALVVDLPEPLAYALVAAGVLAIESDRRPLGWALFGLAAFTKEVTLVFAAAMMASDLMERRWSALLGMGLVAILPFALFQGWLWLTFGQPGIGSGGDMATPFEWVPFMGLLRIGQASWIYLLGMLVVFGSTLLWVAAWGFWGSIQFLRAGDQNMLVLALFLNSLMIVFLPFSTFRETGGLIRLACGLVTAATLFAARYRQRRVLNYSLLWLVLNVFLLKDL
jgi:hypothetical protein